MSIWSFGFEIIAWSAWAPGLTKLEEWQSWSKAPQPIISEQKPPCSFLEPNLRRRISQLARLCLTAAMAPLDQDFLATTRSVFGSRHGECRTSQQLLEMLARNEILSPMGFSLSVHNAVAGAFSIATANQAPTSAIAAGKFSFCCALLDALVSLKREPSQPVLFCFGEELVPDLLEPLVAEERLPFGFAMVISRNCNKNDLTFSFELGAPSKNRENRFSQALDYIRWLLDPQPEICFQLEQQRWKFRKSHNHYDHLFKVTNAI